MISPKMFTSSVLVAILLQTAAAHPGVAGQKTYPEVVPGSGLPSLASLNLTSAELYEMAAPLAARSPVTFQKDFTPGCGPNNAAYTDVNDIIACYHYLENLGTTVCAVPANQGIGHFCVAGNGEVFGQGISGATSSYCRDVATAVLYTINHCTRPDQTVAGYQAAGGNGNLIVGSTVKGYA